MPQIFPGGQMPERFRTRSLIGFWRSDARWYPRQ